MIITKRLKGKAIASWLGPTGDTFRKAVANVKRGLTSGSPRKLDFYFDVGDAWSYVAAQVVKRLVDTYQLELGFHVVTPPASDVDPAPTMRLTHAVRDCLVLASFYDVDFTSLKGADSGSVRDAGTILVRKRPDREQLDIAIEVGHALWTNDKKKLVELAGKYGQDGHGSVAPILNAAYSELRKAGHYQPGAISFGGQWYVGVDRVPYLEAAISDHPVGVLKERPLEERGPLPLGGKGDLALEMWFSFRSPFSYLALEQIEAVLAPYPNIPLVMKPVAPMVARGLPVPTVKRMYLVLDAKREADRLGIPFGEICDPLGKGVDHCLSLMPFAEARGKGLAFAKSAMRGIWAEARDVSEYVDLKFVVERAGLAWDEAKAHLTDAAALKQAGVNATEMAVYSLWGVPSFRIGELVTWGQDRLPIIADRLRRHVVTT